MLKNSLHLFEQYKNYVIQQAKSNLAKGRNSVSKTLYNSIKGEVVADDNYAIIGFKMQKYGLYMDEGVKGAFPGMVNNGKQKAPNSRFRFGNKRPPARVIATWAKQRGIRFRNENGQYENGNYKTIGFILANRIYAQGIKPTLFFTKPYEAGFKKYITDKLPIEVVTDVDRIVDLNLQAK
jgi:hypothetical protein